MTTDPFNAVLLDRQDLTDELCIIRLKPDHGLVPHFEPGQFVTIGLPKQPAAARTDGSASGRPELTRRAYSIASSANVKEYLELYVVLVTDGKLTPRLWNLHPGDRIWMDNRPMGQFTLQGIPSDKDLVMVSTGTGIAPYMSMLRTYAGQTRWHRFVMIHGVRLVQDLGYRQEIEQISDNDPTVIYIPTVTREPDRSSWQGHQGRVQLALEDQTYHRLVGTSLDAKRCHVFLCGNPEMITSVQKTLETRDFVVQTRHRVGNIHLERYW